MQGKKQGRNSCVQVFKLLKNLVSLPIQWMNPTQSTSSSFFKHQIYTKFKMLLAHHFVASFFHEAQRLQLCIAMPQFGTCWMYVDMNFCVCQPYADFTKAGLVQNKLLSNYLFGYFNCFAYYVYQIVYFCNATLRLITVSVLANLIDLLF